MAEYQAQEKVYLKDHIATNQRIDDLKKFVEEMNEEQMLKNVETLKKF